MKKIWKKNQILVSVLAIMIAVAGYLNFAGNKLANEDFMTMGDGVTTTDISDEDIYAVNVTDVDENMQGYATGETYDITDIDEDVATITDNYLDEPMATNIGEVADASDAAESGVDLSEETPGEAVFTSGNGVSSLAGAKLIKEQTRAKNKQTLMEIINNEGIAETEKQDAINTMIAMTDVAEKESAAEVLLEAKGYKGIVVSINDENADVIVGSKELTESQTAQIMDIVSRKTEVAPENIVITVVP